MRDFISQCEVWHVCWYLETSLSPPVVFLLTVAGQCLFCGSFLLFVFVCDVCFLPPCGCLLGGGWPLGFL